MKNDTSCGTNIPNVVAICYSLPNGQSRCAIGQDICIFLCDINPYGTHRIAAVNIVIRCRGRGRSKVYPDVFDLTEAYLSLSDCVRVVQVRYVCGKCCFKRRNSGYVSIDTCQTLCPG